MILVTGLTGKSGSWFLKKLIEESDNVKNLKFRATIRNGANILEINKNDLDLEYVIGDLTDQNFVNESMCDIETVLHIADLGLSENIIKAAVKYNVNRVILVHTTGVYSKYKLATKEYFKIENNITNILKGSNINLTILRPTMIYGSVSDENIIVFVKMVNRFRFFPIVNHGKYELQPIHAKDLGVAYYQLLMNEKTTHNKEYILSGKKPIYFVDLLKIISETLNKKTIFIHIPFPLAYFLAFILYLASFGKVDYREKVQRLIEPRAFSHKEATKDFGYMPMSIEEGIKDEVNQFLNQNKR